MSKESEALKEVYSQVGGLVNEMYERYRKKWNLEETKDTERQLEILTSKKYISITFITDLSLIADYKVRGMVARYEAKLREYKTRVQVMLETIPSV